MISFKTKHQLAKLHRRIRGFVYKNHDQVFIGLIGFCGLIFGYTLACMVGGN